MSMALEGALYYPDCQSTVNITKYVASRWLQHRTIANLFNKTFAETIDVLWCYMFYCSSVCDFCFC